MGLDAIFLAGPEIAETYAALKESDYSGKLFYCADFSGWVNDLKKFTAMQNCCVLIKASRAMNFDIIMTEVI